MGKVEAVWKKRARRGVMDPVERAHFVAGKGIANDANYGTPKRHVTIISREIFDRIRERLPDVRPEMRRANVMVGGIDLADTRGRILRLGGVRIRILGETRPCERMDEQVPGLTAALGQDWSGGVFGEVLNDGEVAVGAVASFEK